MDIRSQNTTNFWTDVPGSQHNRWYRYHQVFADVLRQHLQQNAATQIPELHRRATRWYREQGMLAEAVTHAHAAKDWESIAIIAEETGVELMSRGETRMVMAWVTMLPRSLVFSRLRLFLFGCWYRWYDGQAAVVVEMFREYTLRHALPGLEVEDVVTLERAISAHVDILYPRPRVRHELRTHGITEGPAPTPGYLERLILLFNREQQTSLTASEDASFPLVEPLSERDVLWRISEGRSNREIAEQLVIAPSTVKSHIRAIYSKLGVESRTLALARVRRLKQILDSSSPG